MTQATFPDAPAGDGMRNTEGQQLIIRVADLRKRYQRGRVPAVEGVSFEVRKGRVYGLIGPDGAGKTSILQILAGVLSADSGAAHLAGIDVLARPEAVKPLIGYMPQGLGLNLYDTLSVEENIEFFRALRQVPERRFRENRDRLLAMTRLAPFLARPAGKLSGGMRQKLALICTLIHLPDLLLLDEPTTGVDPISRRDFWTIIQDLVTNRGVSVLLTTSYMDEAERCNFVGLMADGEIIAAGAPDKLIAEMPGRLQLVGGALPQSLIRILEQWPETESVALFGEQAHLLLADDSIDVAARLQQAGVAQPVVRDIPAGLEDVFVHHVMRKRAAARALGADLAGLVADPPPMQDSPIRTEGITCRFGDFTAVDAVSLEVHPGEILGLLGPNGAGKTTLIKMLCGLQKPSAGRAQVAGLDLGARGARRALRGRIGYMSQRFSLYRDLKVAANLDLYAGLYGLPAEMRRQRIEGLLAGLGLAQYAERRTVSLPLGLRQRLALACALLHEPRLLFLDEPTSGVDPVARRQFWDWVHLLAQEGGITVLVSTHYMDEAEHCNRLGLMHQGRLVALGAPAELKAAAEGQGGPMVAVQAHDFAEAYQRLHARFPDAMLYGRRIQWQSPEPEPDIEITRAMLAEAGIEARVSRQGLTMEEAFVHFVEQAGNGRA